MSTKVNKNRGKCTSLLETYKACERDYYIYKNSYIILENTFIAFDFKKKKVVSKEDIKKEFKKMYIVSKELDLSQFIFYSHDGFEEDCDIFEQFNLRLEDYRYTEELNSFKGNYVELLAHNRAASKWAQKQIENKELLNSIVQPTGTGKSYILDSIIKRYPKGIKLILAPSNYILDQFKELVSSKEEELVEFMFMTYYKLSRMSDEELLMISPTIIILDEYHRAGATEWGKSVRRLLSLYTDIPVIGTTATPIRYLDNARDMSKEIFKGNSYEKLDIAQAITRNILPLPKYVTAIYNIEGMLNSIKEQIDNCQKISIDKEKLYNEIRRFKASWDNVEYMPRLIKKHVNQDMKRFIVFCRNHEHLEEMRDTVSKWFITANLGKNIETFSVSSLISDSKDNFNKFKNSNGKDTISLLFCINMLNEGIHIEFNSDVEEGTEINLEDINKTVDGVIFTRATASNVIYHQQLGRAMMASSKKQPLILDLVNNIEHISDMSFKEEIIEAYKSHEERLSEIAQINSKENYLSKIDVSLKDETHDFRLLIQNTLHFLRNDWDSMYNILLSYKEEYGDCNVPKNPSNKKYASLGHWVSYTRRKYSIGKLEPKCIEKLNFIGFTWDILSDNWLQRYNFLKLYIEINDTSVITDKGSEYTSLGIWCSKQRLLYNSSLLSSEKVNLLNGINFNWNPRNQEPFDCKVKDLYKYKTKYGTCDIPSTEEGEYKLLGRWVDRMRKDKRQNKLTKYEIETLDNLGFSWSVRDTLWTECYLILKELFEKNGNLYLRSNDKNYQKVTVWSTKQRRYYAEGKLSRERIEKLDAINFNWSFASKKALSDKK